MVFTWEQLHSECVSYRCVLYICTFTITATTELQKGVWMILSAYMIGIYDLTYRSVVTGEWETDFHIGNSDMLWLLLNLVMHISNLVMYILYFTLLQIIHIPLRLRHNERNGVSNHQPHDCLFNRLFGRWSKKTSKLRVPGLCEGNSLICLQIIVA